MKLPLPSLFGALGLVTSTLGLMASASAQVETQTSIPPGIRALLEQQSRASNPYEQMAKMQVSARYSELLALYEAERRPDIEAVMIRVFGERMELSARMTSAGANPEDLRRASSAEYLRQQLVEVLTGQELQLYDDFLQGTSERQLRNTYGEQLQQAAPNVTEANREVVLDSMVRHMLLERTDVTDPEEMISQQLQSLMDVRMELEQRLDAGQFQAALPFLDRVQSNLYRNRGMYEAMEDQ